jgi:hypothetical protein
VPVHTRRVGAQGIRRRKPKRPLPPARLSEHDESSPPHIMWPGPGSGFEADEWSPAGRAQQMWRFSLGLSRGRGQRAIDVAFVAFVGVVGLVLLAQVVSLLL